MSAASISDLLGSETEQRKSCIELNPRFAFAGQFQNPFFIILHFKEISTGLNSPDDGLVEEVRREIGDIKSQYGPNNFIEWEGSATKVPCGLPLGRPILVVGAFGGVCVDLQYGALTDANYDAYISREGVMPIN